MLSTTNLKKINVTSLVGLSICKACRVMLNKKNPTTSILNNMDVGNLPNEIKNLNFAEALFIRQVKGFETIFKAGSVSGKILHNQRLSSLKLLVIHMPLPIQKTLDQLKDRHKNITESNNANSLLIGNPSKRYNIWKKSSTL